MTPRSVAHESKSIKTFFLYAAIVLFFIILSLAIKTFFVIQQSKFDGENQFTIAIAKDKKVEKIIIFRPEDKTITALSLEGSKLSLSGLGKNLNIIPDGTIEARYDIPLSPVTDTISSALYNYNNLKTELTLYDLIRLFFLAQKIQNNLREEKIVVTKNQVDNEQQVDTLLVDNKIFSENVSIQIINASGAVGIGKRLEQALSNWGANVVAVSTARNEESKSKIQYFGEESYTLKKLARVLTFPTEVLPEEPLAAIVIIIGKDQKNSEIF